MSEKLCPVMSRVVTMTPSQENVHLLWEEYCHREDCAWWEEMTDSCSIKAQQRHVRAWSMGLTELGMALVDILRRGDDGRED